MGASRRKPVMPSPARPKPPAKPDPARAPNPSPIAWTAGLAGVVVVLLLFLAVSF